MSNSLSLYHKDYPSYMDPDLINNPLWEPVSSGYLIPGIWINSKEANRRAKALGWEKVHPLQYDWSWITKYGNKNDWCIAMLSVPDSTVYYNGGNGSNWTTQFGTHIVHEDFKKLIMRPATARCDYGTRTHG